MKLERGNRVFCWFLLRLLGLLPVIGVLVFTLIKFLPRIEAASYDMQVTLTASCNLYTSGGTYATLSVTEPTAEICSYWNDATSIGGWMSLTADYERYHLADAMNGYYYIEVEMNELDSDAYCQVVVTLYEGASNETVIVYGPFRMYMQKLQVGCFKMPEAIERCKKFLKESPANRLKSGGKLKKLRGRFKGILQYDITDEARVWYRVDRKNRVVYIEYVGHHP